MLHNLHHRNWLRHRKHFQRFLEADFSMISSSGKSGRETWNVNEIIWPLGGLAGERDDVGLPERDEATTTTTTNITNYLTFLINGKFADCTKTFKTTHNYSRHIPLQHIQLVTITFLPTISIQNIRIFSFFSQKFKFKTLIFILDLIAFLLQIFDYYNLVN